MKLWHQYLIKDLPNYLLLGQHSECCALRGKAWTFDKKGYVFKHTFERLIAYHFIVIEEMEKRNYTIDKKWIDPLYNGKHLPYDCRKVNINTLKTEMNRAGLLYDEHNQSYLMECEYCGETLISNEHAMDHAGRCPVMNRDNSPEENTELVESCQQEDGHYHDTELED